MGSNAFHILVIDDSDEDVEIMREVIRETTPHLRLHSVEDGREAMAFLYREGAYAHVPRPDLILLDLNMPREDGREVLAKIKQSRELCAIPVIILTTSEAEQDIAASYQQHANCYITKPADLTLFTEVMEAIVKYWFNIVTLPLNQE